MDRNSNTEQQETPAQEEQFGLRSSNLNLSDHENLIGNRQEVKQQEEHTLTIFGAALSIIASCIGAGMVSLPYAYLHLGLVTTLALMAFSIGRVTSSTYLLMKTKDLIPGQPSSFFEIGYILIGRSSIFILSLTLFSYCTLLCIAYFYLFGGIVSTIIQQLSGLSDKTESDDYSFFATIQFSVLVLAVLLVSIIFKKEIHELKIVSFMLFFFLVAFLLLLFIQVCIYEPAHFIQEHEKVTFVQQLTPTTGLTFFQVITSINTVNFSLSITSNVFPTYASLRNKTTANMNKSLVLGLLMTVGVYTIYSITCIMLFGETLELTEGNSLDNIGINEEGDWQGIVLQVFFFIVLGAHIPFMFFVGKESILILLDELDRKSISLTLQKRMDYYNQIYGMELPKERDTKNWKQTETAAKEGRETKNNERKTKVMEIAPNRISEFIGKPRTSSNVDDQRLKSQVRGKSFVPTKLSMLAPLRETQTLRCSSNFGVPVMTVDEQTGEQKMDNKLAYKDMKTTYYLIGTVVYFMFCVVGGMYIPNVEIVINWTSSIQIVIIGFFSPAVFYTLARKRFPENIDHKMDFFLRCNVVGQYFLGFASMGLGMYVNIASLIPGHNEEYVKPEER